jgi:hypothetical protein
MTRSQRRGARLPPSAGGAPSAPWSRLTRPDFHLITDGIDLRRRPLLIGFRLGKPVLARKPIKQVPGQTEFCIPGLLVRRVKSRPKILLCVNVGQAAVAIEAQRWQVGGLCGLDLGPGGAKLFHLLHEVRTLRQRPVDRRFNRVGEVLRDGQILNALDLELAGR